MAKLRQLFDRRMKVESLFLALDLDASSDRERRLVQPGCRRARDNKQGVVVAVLKSPSKYGKFGTSDLILGKFEKSVAG